MPREDLQRDEPTDFPPGRDEPGPEGEGTSMKIYSLFGRISLTATGFFCAGAIMALVAGELEVAILGALLACGTMVLAEHDAEFCAARRGAGR